MFSISVVFGSVSWMLIFRDKDRAQIAAAALMAVPQNGAIGIQVMVQETIVTDDFGQTVHCKSAPNALMVEDWEASKLGIIEVQMRQVHIQHDVRARAENDTALRMRRGGPAIVSPFMGAPPNGR